MLKILTSELLSCLNKVAPIVAPYNPDQMTVNQDSSVLIKGTHDDANEIEIISHNKQSNLRVRVYCLEHKAFTPFVVEHNQLARVTKAGLRNEVIIIERDPERKGVAQIRFRNRQKDQKLKYEIQADDLKTFNLIDSTFPKNQKFSFEREALNQIVDLCQRSMVKPNKSDVMDILKGMHLRSDKGDKGLYVTTTNRYSLSHCQYDAEDLDPTSLTLSNETVSIISRSFAAEAPIQLEIGQDKIKLSQPGITYITATLSGGYPDVKMLLPTSSVLNSITINAALLLEQLLILAPIKSGQSQPIMIKVDKDMTLSMKAATIGTGQTIISAGNFELFEEDKLELILLYDELVSVLTSIGDREIAIDIRDLKKSIVINVGKLDNIQPTYMLTRYVTMKDLTPKVDSDGNSIRDEKAA